MRKFMKVHSDVLIDGEAFHISDILSVCPEYEHTESLIHFYDGKQHYVSDGKTQSGRPLPCHSVEDLGKRLPELRMCRSQREIDDRYFENLRNQRR
jgi:hypothetical protein